MSQGPEPALGTMRPARPMWALFVGLAAAIVVADQLSKAWIVTQLAPDRVIHVVGDYLRLVLWHNDGAIFGLFRGGAPVFGLISLAVVGLVVGFHARAGRNPYLTLTLGLLLGGALGNLVDRLRLGYVVDFVDAGIGGTRFYTFNVADSCISGAVVLLVLLSLRPSLATIGRAPDA